MLAACSGSTEPAEPPVLVRDVVRYLRADTSALEQLERSPHGTPLVRELSPPGPRRDARRALLLPPPARVRFEVRPEEDGALLATSTAVRGRVAPRADGAPPPWLVLEVRRNGEVAWSRRTRSDADAESGAWEDVLPPRGLPVRAGDAIELVTRCEDDAGEPADPGELLVAGFGRLRLERQRVVERARSSPSEPNLVLFLQDTLRRDRLSTYGYGRPTSPVLDRLAARGTVFDEAYAASSWTWPSTASILTGLLPERHGVRNEEACYVAAELELLSEALQGVGFTTGAFSANALIHSSKNFDQGFERFVGNAAGFAESEDLVPRALDWLRENAGRRFFLYLHLADTHGLGHVLPEARERFAADVPADFAAEDFLVWSDALRRARTGGVAPGDPRTEALEAARRAESRRAVDDLYDAAVYSGDLWLGRVLATLEELGVADETVVAFTSDHGEELYDHGLLRHGHSLHGELVRAPLVIAGPGVPVGRRVATAVSNRHLAPTLARLGGARLGGPDDPLDLLAGDLPERPVFFSTDHGLWRDVPGRTVLSGVRAGPWVLHATEGDAVLYRLDGDPAEERDVAGENGERVQALRELVLERAARGAAVDGGSGAGEMTRELLDEIGYLGGD